MMFQRALLAELNARLRDREWGAPMAMVVKSIRAKQWIVAQPTALLARMTERSNMHSQRSVWANVSQAIALRRSLQMVSTFVRGRFALATGVCAGVLWALALYRPWLATPFPVSDFSDFLPRFTQSTSVLESLRQEIADYAAEGRFIPLTIVFIASNWSAWGWNTVAWGWTKFFCMVAVALAAVLLLRRFGASSWGALLGGALFVCAGSATAAWLMPQVWDSIAVICVLGATFMALDFRRSARPRVLALWIGGLLALAALFAEPFVACVPFVLVVAWCSTENGRLALRRLTRRDAILLVIVASMLVAFVVAPAIIVRSMSRVSAYASRYEFGAVTSERAANVLRATVLPLTRVVYFPGNAGAIALVVGGAVVLARRGRGNRHEWMVLAVALLLIASTAALYMPWPAFPGHYAYKALFGVALLLAFGVTWIQRGNSRAARVGAAAVTLVILAYGSVLTVNAVEWYRARMRVESAASGVLASLGSGSHAAVAVEDPEWSGSFGRAMLNYASAEGTRPMPSVEDWSCVRAAAAISRASGTAIFAIPEQCRTMPVSRAPSRRIAIEAAQLDLKTLRARRDSAIVRIWLPEGR